MESVSAFIERFQLEAGGGKLAKGDGGLFLSTQEAWLCGSVGAKPPLVPEGWLCCLMGRITLGMKLLGAKAPIDMSQMMKMDRTTALAAAYRMDFTGDRDRGGKQTKRSSQGS